MRLSSGNIALQRIAILGSRGFPSTYGGYETLVRFVARDWVSRGLDVTVYCRQKEGQRHWMTEGVECQWTPGRESSSLSTLTYGATSLPHAAFRSFDAALVLNIANGFWLPWLRAANVPTVVNTDGIEWERGKWGRVARSLFRVGASMSARHADVLLADSTAIAEIWKELFCVDSIFVPYGAPILTDVPTDKIWKLGLKPGGYVLSVARLIPENNVDLFLDALDVLGDSRPPAVVVGSSSAPSSLDQRLNRLHESGRVLWLGHVGDQELLNQLWAHCGVYVHGHSVGGTNPALLQALGSGAPTIALDTPFNREVLGAAGEKQFFSRSENALAFKMQVVLESGALQDELRKAGRQTVATRYTWPSVSDGYLSALEMAVSRRRERRHGAIWKKK